MVKVCQSEYPLTDDPKDRRKEPGFYLHENLKRQIDYYLKNITQDWDFTILICGEGEVRVGKSVLAMEIAAYWTSEIKRLYNIEVPFDVKNNFVFNGRDLIKKGNDLGTKHKYSCLIFDEAGADLEGVKAMRFTTQAVKDYLRECGQYNMLNILVLPEYFDLPKGIAISRSNCLINVYWLPDDEGNFKRGYFKFYSRPAKKLLYINGKKNLDYNASHYDFYGDFVKFYPVNEEEYREAKRRALKNREMLSAKELRQREFLRGAFKYMRAAGLTYYEIADKISELSPIKMSHMYVARLLGGADGEDTDDEP